VLNTYGSDDADKAAGGSVGPVPATAEGPERDALFALQAGQYGAPVALADGRQAILMLEDVVPPRAQELAEVADMIVKRIQNKREEMAFRAALDGWKKQVKIEVFEDRLAKTRSWKELTDAAKPTVAKAGK
jgi:parvulin-like peptidyl-prolyl isomerase